MEIAEFPLWHRAGIKDKVYAGRKSCTSKQYAQLLEKLQYKNVELRTFDSNTISDMIMKWLPVWTVGGPANNEHATHAWLIDGLCKQTRTVEQYSGLIFVAKYNQSRTLYQL